MLEILFLYIWMEHVPAFDPCSGNTCLAIAARPAYSQTHVERFKSRGEAFMWISEKGKPGKLVDVQTGVEQSVEVRPVKRVVERVVKEEVVTHYEIESSAGRDGATGVIPGGRIIFNNRSTMTIR